MPQARTGAVSATAPPARSPNVPLRRNLAAIYLVSLLIAALTVAASVAGIVWRTAVYPTEELRGSFVANDVVNLALGVPLLLGSIVLTWRGRLLGLLFWPGALLYVLYNEIAYLLALPLSGVWPLHLALVALAAYTVIGLVAAIDGPAVQQRLTGAVPTRLTGGILAGLGLLFLGLAVNNLLGAILGGAPLTEAALGTQVADALVVPTWIIGGLMLWRRTELGYVAGLGLLFQASMLFIGLIAFLLLRPLLSTVPFDLGEIVVVAVMGLICFVPLALFVRGVARRAR